MSRDSWNDDTGTGRPDFLSTHHAPQGRSALAEIESHWRELKADSPHLPRRADLDASRIAPALSHAFILERAAPGVGRLRFAGRALSELLGTEARGLPLSVFFTPPARKGLQGWLERCFEAPALVDLPIEARQGPLRPVLTGRLLLLPMLDSEGGVTRAVGGIFVNGPKRASIVKFDLTDAPARCEILPQPARLAVYATSPTIRARGLAEAGRPYLRLVVNNS